MSKYLDESLHRKAQHTGTVTFEDDTNTLKVFTNDATPKPTLEIGSWWDGCGGEWTPEYLTVNLDRSGVLDLRDTLTLWLRGNK